MPIPQIAAGVCGEGEKMADRGEIRQFQGLSRRENTCLRGKRSRSPLFQTPALYSWRFFSTACCFFSVRKRQPHFCQEMQGTPSTAEASLGTSTTRPETPSLQDLQSGRAEAEARTTPLSPLPAAPTMWAARRPSMLLHRGEPVRLPSPRGPRLLLRATSSGLRLPRPLRTASLAP